jgi:NAD(P)-dependent dehydrogenase (short-subunit alcohol dehydrogenase family)
MCKSHTILHWNEADGYRLVNNAGISVEAGKQPCRIHETPEEWWDLTIAVNLKSIFLTSKYTIAQMLKQEKSESGDRGWIINISSIFGEVGGYTIRKNIFPANLLLY